eukprot:1187616-Prorocentrum_minimum.AAC.8
MVCRMITGYEQQRCSRFPEARLRASTLGLVPRTYPYGPRLRSHGVLCVRAEGGSCTVRQSAKERLGADYRLLT